MAHSATNKSYTLTMLTNTVCFKRVTLPPFRQEHISYLFISHIFPSFSFLIPGQSRRIVNGFLRKVSVLCLVFRPKKSLRCGSSCWTGMARLVNLLLSVAISKIETSLIFIYFPIFPFQPPQGLLKRPSKLSWLCFPWMPQRLVGFQNCEVCQLVFPPVFRLQNSRVPQISFSLSSPLVLAGQALVVEPV